MLQRAKLQSIVGVEIKFIPMQTKLETNSMGVPRYQSLSAGQKSLHDEI